MKSNKFSSLVILILLLPFVSCSQSGKNDLPSKWPANASLSIEYGGGMRWYSDKTFISAGGSYFSKEEEGKSSVQELQFTQQQLDSLMRFLKAKNFSAIHSAQRDGIVYDMGTTTITLTIGDKIYAVSIGATQQVAARYANDFSAVQQFIYKMLAGGKW